jgi:cysteine-rich repeat protein
MNPNFNEAWFSYGGTFSHTINNRVEEPIQGRPEVEMNNVQFRVVNGVTYWQSNILSRDAFLVSTRKVVNTAGTQWRDASTRDPRSATASRVVNGTRSTVDICSTGVQQGCGNSTLEPTLGEQCDDGNTTEGDGCNGACVIEYCGNEYWEESRGEECDDGNGVGGDGCSATCHIEYCGDGIVQSGLDETCDDGNGENGDGCSTLCTIEVPESSSSSSSFSSSMSSSSFSSSFSSGMSSSWSSSF